MADAKNPRIGSELDTRHMAETGHVAEPGYCEECMGPVERELRGFWERNGFDVSWVKLLMDRSLSHDSAAFVLMTADRLEKDETVPTSRLPLLEALSETIEAAHELEKAGML